MSPAATITMVAGPHLPSPSTPQPVPLLVVIRGKSFFIPALAPAGVRQNKTNNHATYV